MTNYRTLSRLPVGGGERVEVVLIGECRQPREDIAHISEGIMAVALAGDDDRVNDSGALAGIGMANEEPVLFVMLSSA